MYLIVCFGQPAPTAFCLFCSEVFLDVLCFASGWRPSTIELQVTYPFETKRQVLNHLQEGKPFDDVSTNPTVQNLQNTEPAHFYRSVCLPRNPPQHFPSGALFMCLRWGRPTAVSLSLLQGVVTAWVGFVQGEKYNQATYKDYADGLREQWLARHPALRDKLAELVC